MTTLGPKWRQAVLTCTLICLFSGAVKTQTLTRLGSPEVLRACGQEATSLRFSSLAQLVAPVYWFSPDEPLITSANRDIDDVSIPTELPRVRDVESPATDVERVVYYRIKTIRFRDNVKSNERRHFAQPPGLGSTVVPLDKVSLLHIRYLSYYPFDVGVGRHAHDLEVVEVELTVEPMTHNAVQCHAVRVARVTGAAHGSDWYSNVLQVPAEMDDLVLPPHILVEEGKHASAPDRNADGWFTPGYDATRNANDAWGVRDTIRTNRLRSRIYDSTQAKDRCANPQLALSRQWSQRLQTVPAQRRYVRKNPTLTHCFLDHPSARFAVYALMEAGVGSTTGFCTGTTVTPATDSGLKDLLEKWKFCDRTVVKGERGWGARVIDVVLAGPQGPSETPRDRFTVAARWAGGNGSTVRGMASIVPGFGMRLGTLGGGWLVPRLSVGRSGFSLDGLYTPSGSRIVGWYVAVGRDWWLEPGWGGVAEEVGLRLRFPPYKLAWGE